MNNILLPLFPLQLVVFPGEPLNLHIFEPRYRQLIRECKEEGGTFGIPAYITGEVQEVGTEIELIDIVKKYPKGEMDIKTRGKGIFRIQEFYQQAPQKLYPGGEVIPLTYTQTGSIEKNRKIASLATKLFKLLKVDKELIKDADKIQTFDLAHHIGFSLEQEYDFLCIREEQERQDFMIQHLKQLIPVVKNMEKLRQRIQMNGHFRNIIPPEI